MYYDGLRKFPGYNKNGIYREYVGSKITNTDALLEVMTTVTGYDAGFRVIFIDSPNKGLPCFTLEGPKNREWVVNFEKKHKEKVGKEKKKQFFEFLLKGK